MQQYPNVDRMKKQMAGDPALPLRQQEMQQYLLYAASNDVFSPDLLTPEARMARPKDIDLVAAHALVEKVQRSPYAAAHWPRFFDAPLTTVDNDVSDMERSFYFLISSQKRYTGAYTDTKGSKLNIPVSIHLADNGFAMNTATLLHELAHAVDAWENPNYRGQDDGHGPRFAQLNIEIIREFMSPQTAHELENAFQYAGVKVAPELQPHRSLR